MFYICVCGEVEFDFSRKTESNMKGWGFVNTDEEKT